MSLVLESLTVKAERMREACKTGYLNATDLADYLVAKGVALRRGPSPGW